MSMRLFLLQRTSAALLAVMVLLHLALIAYAVRDGLSAAEILARTRENTIMLVYYGLFAAMAALHGGIGLRTILLEWGRIGDGPANIVASAASVSLLALGLRAVWAVGYGGAP